jgi:hypothetical protein
MKTWNRWIESLYALKKIEVRRSFKPANFGTAKERSFVYSPTPVMKVTVWVSTRAW